MSDFKSYIDLIPGHLFLRVKCTACVYILQSEEWPAKGCVEEMGIKLHTLSRESTHVCSKLPVTWSELGMDEKGDMIPTIRESKKFQIP